MGESGSEFVVGVFYRSRRAVLCLGRAATFNSTIEVQMSYQSNCLSRRLFRVALAFAIVPFFGSTQVSAGPLSEAFNSPTALKAPGVQKITRLTKPTYQGYRIDNCLSFGSNCGKPAADATCSLYNAGSALPRGGFRTERVFTKTIMISSGGKCDPTRDSCDGFAYVTCTK